MCHILLMRLPTLLSVLALPGLVALVACSSPPSDDGAEGSESDLTVTPSGTNGSTTMTVTVNIPPPIPQTFTLDGSRYSYEITFQGVKLQAGKPKVVPVGNGQAQCLTANLLKNGYAISTGFKACDWHTPGRGSLTIDLGTAKLWWTGYPELRTDVASLDDSVPTITRPGSREGQYGGARGDS